MIFNSINNMVITDKGNNLYEVKVLDSKRRATLHEKIDSIYGIVRKPLSVNRMMSENSRLIRSEH